VKTSQYFKIGKKKLNEKSQPFFVAEIGINFNGSLEIAKQNILMAKKYGADSVKFQYYKTNDFLSNKNLKLKFKIKKKIVVKTQFEIFKKNELSFKNLRALKDYADMLNINFHATPTNERGVDELIDIGVKYIKNGSDFLTHTDLLKKVALHKLPIIISTGMSTVKDISYALSFFQEYNRQNIILLHCVSNYPTMDKDANLSRINSLRKKFKILIGYSDHTIGNDSAIIAKSFGSVWFEKHFTINNDFDGPDQNFSSNPENFLLYKKNVLECRKNFIDQKKRIMLLGNGNINFNNNEKISRREFTLSCVSKKNLPINTVLNESHITFKRPGTGLKPYMADQLIGKRLKKSIKKDVMFKKFFLK